MSDSVTHYIEMDNGNEVIIISDSKYLEHCFIIFINYNTNASI